MTRHVPDITRSNPSHFNSPIPENLSKEDSTKLSSDDNNHDNHNDNNDTSRSHDKINNHKRRQIQPTDIDILCGKDKKSKCHIGNHELRLAIEHSTARYAAVMTKNHKASITKEIYDYIGTTGSRFLRKKTTTLKMEQNQNQREEWEELSQMKARDKISHALRARISNYNHDDSSNSSISARNIQQLPIADIITLHQSKHNDIGNGKNHPSFEEYRKNLIFDDKNQNRILHHDDDNNNNRPMNPSIHDSMRENGESTESRTSNNHAALKKQSSGGYHHSQNNSDIHSSIPKRKIRPTNNDILCGRDRCCTNHPGYGKFRDVIKQHTTKYANITNKSKRVHVTKEIYAQFRSNGSRFLRLDCDNQEWEELSIPTARDKISHALRFNLGQIKNQQQKDNVRGFLTAEQERVVNGLIARTATAPTASSTQENLNGIIDNRYDKISHTLRHNLSRIRNQKQKVEVDGLLAAEQERVVADSIARTATVNTVSSTQEDQNGIVDNKYDDSAITQNHPKSIVNHFNNSTNTKTNGRNNQQQSYQYQVDPATGVVYQLVMVPTLIPITITNDTIHSGNTTANKSPIPIATTHYNHGLTTITTNATTNATNRSLLPIIRNQDGSFGFANTSKSLTPDH